MMLTKTSTELLKSIERSRKETNVKIKSLSRLLEALDTVAEVLGRAADRFQAKGGQNPSPLTKDIVEPNTLGIHFSYFKDLPLKVSSRLLRRKQAESESELSALQKKQQRLATCQGTIPVEKDHNYQARKKLSTLPRIEEDRLCTPKISLAKVRMDENGLFKLTEEYTNMGEEEVEGSAVKSPIWDSRDGSDSKDSHGSALYSDLIDFDVMEKLHGMDPKTRGDFTAQFYRELFEESDWLLPAKKKENTVNAFVKTMDHSIEQPAVSTREAVRARKKARDVHRGLCSDLTRLFTGKKKGRSYKKKDRKLQTQNTVQCQESFKDQLISKKPTKRVSQRTTGTHRQQDILQDVASSMFTAELSDCRKHMAGGGNKQLTEKFSRFQQKKSEIEAGMGKRLKEVSVQ